MNLDTPAFLTEADAGEWLARAPTNDAGLMQAMLLRQLNLLLQATLSPNERLGILETLRDAIHAAQDEVGRKFAGKPLPLPQAEQTAFDSGRGLWRALAGSYMRCIEACCANEPGMKPKAALLFERALFALAREQYDTHRAGRVPTVDHWHALHQLYATAEQLGVTQQEIGDPLRIEKLPSTPLAVYVECLLLSAAALHEHAPKQMVWIARWARRWSGKVGLLESPPTLSTRAIPLCVDLASDKPAGYMPLGVPSARWLETVQLQQSLKKRIMLLDQGEPPAKLHLGDDCQQPACGEVLRQVYLRWTKGGATRQFERRPTHGTCRFIGGFDAVHYYLSERKPFREAPRDADTLRRQREEIATFGRIKTQDEENYSQQHGYSIENWEAEEDWRLVDTSTTGMRLSRPLSQAGARIGHGALVAVSPPGAQAFLLGSVRWVLAVNAELLQAGVAYFPGAPSPVAMRPVTTDATKEKLRQAFLLPAVPALKEPETIVIPVGTFKLERVLEVVVSEPGRKIRLDKLLERGADFERASYTAL